MQDSRKPQSHELLEVYEHALRMKAKDTEAVFFLTAQLPKLNVFEHEYFLPELLAIFFSADVTLFGKITDWLAEAYGVTEAQRLVGHAISNWAGMPLVFERTSSYGTIIACRCGAPKDAGDGGGDDESDDEVTDAYGKSKKNPHGSASKFVEEVAATTETQPFIKGTILAAVREGDLVRLKSHSRLWWTVFEMRPARGAVLLCNKESRVTGSLTAAKREPKTEYKEVKIAALLGCLVRREGVLSPRTMEHYNKQSRDIEFQDRLICCPKDSEREGFVGASADGYFGEGSRRVTILFQIPGPDLRTSLVRIKALVAEFPKPDEGCVNSQLAGPASSKKILRPPTDPVEHMQYQAQAKAWVSRWEEAQRARQLLQKMEPLGCVLLRERWLLTARALKTISRGSTELLQDYIDMTASAGREGKLRAKDCRVAWESLRPTTSADFPALSKARAYLKIRGMGKDKAFFDEEGRLRPDAMKADPLSRGILEAASTYLADRSIVFLDQSLDCIKVPSSVAANLDEAAVLVAAAIYDHYLMGGVESMPSEARTVYVGVETARAFLTPGDVLLVRGSLGDEAQAQAGSGTNRNQTWVQIISVDLLFARLRVVPCTVPPPLCWYEPSLRPESLSHAGSIDAPAMWLPLSRVWDVVVCRLLPMLDPAEATERRGRHLIFVSPMPSPAQALAVLGAFDRKSDSGESAAAKQKQEKAEPGKGKGKSTGNQRRVLRRSIPPPLPSSPGRDAKRASQELRSSRSGARFSIAALSYFTDAVIVAWSAITVVPQPFINVRGELMKPTSQDCQVLYELDVAHVSRPYDWLRVYSGAGVGCQISGLESLQQYYCRVTASATLPQTLEFRRGGKPNDIEKVLELERRRAQTVVTTLGLAVSAAPTISSWEQSTSGSARGLVTVFSKDTFFVPELPAECFFQVEASLGPADRGTARDEDDEAAASNWAAVGRTRKAQCWCVGPFSGRSILMRTRVVNQIGQPGPSSPVAIVMVPELSQGAERSDVTGKKGRDRLNDSGISDITR